MVQPFVLDPNGLNGGTKSTIVCTVTGGDSPMQIRWLKDERAFEPSAADKAKKVLAVDETTSMLSFNRLDLEDAGTYTCRAENAAGFAQYSTVLRVKGREY